MPIKIVCETMTSSQNIFLFFFFFFLGLVFITIFCIQKSITEIFNSISKKYSFANQDVNDTIFVRKIKRGKHIFFCLCNEIMNE